MMRCLYGECSSYALAQVKVGTTPARRLCGAHIATTLTDAVFDEEGCRVSHPPEVRVVLLGAEDA